MSQLNDKRLINPDFIFECGDLLVTAGAAVVAAASAERLDVLELALQQARNTLIEMISEFKSIDAES